jgi:uncharacterized protein YndB with AHSA1/START domain
MPNDQSTVPKTIHKSIIVDAPLRVVWEALTRPELMKSWMADSEIEIVTTWELGSPITINIDAVSFKNPFTNNGIVLAFENEHLLEYSHLSSISQLPDEPGSYTTIRFTLEPEEEERTLLQLDLSNFPNYVHCKHVDFYWTVTLGVFKRFVEARL